MSNFVAQLLDIGHQYEGMPTIFKDVNFGIEKGSFHFLTGPSGSGKSSLLKMLYLDLKPTWGSLRLFGEETAKMNATHIPYFRQEIGVVFQEFKLLDHLKVVDNVSLPLRIRGLDAKQSRKKALELLHWVELGDRLDVYPYALSGGEKQRVAIARAVIGQPELLLADEPTGNVDDEMAMKLLHLFEELNKRGATVVIATHNPRLIERTSYPQLTLTEGTILQRPNDNGTTNEPL